MITSQWTGKPAMRVEILLDEYVIAGSAGNIVQDLRGLRDKLVEMETELVELREKVNGKQSMDDAVAAARKQVADLVAQYDKQAK